MRHREMERAGERPYHSWYEVRPPSLDFGAKVRSMFAYLKAWCTYSTPRKRCFIMCLAFARSAFILTSARFCCESLVS